MNADLLFEADPNLGARARNMTEEIVARLSGIPGVSVTRVKTSSSSQDLGTTLAVVLGAPSVVVLAKAIFEITKHYSAGLKITTRSGTIIATGDAARNITRNEVASLLANLVGFDEPGASGPEDAASKPPKSDHE